MALSLAIAFTVTPWLALKLMKPHAPAATRAAQLSAGRSPQPAAPLRPRLLTPLLDSARKRWLLLAGILAALMLSVGLAVVQWVVLKMLPFDNKSEFQLVRRHARRHAAGRHRRRAARAGALPGQAARGAATCRATPARPARSPSTAWCASTTCAPTPSRATCRSTWSTRRTATSRATPSRSGCGRRWRRSRPSATARG